MASSSSSSSSSSPSSSSSAPLKYAVALFPGFQALDFFGPIDILNLLARQDLPDMSLYVLSSTLDPVSTLPPPPPPPSSPSSSSAQSPQTPPPPPKFPMSQAIQPTHTYATCPDDIEVLIVPGGVGCHRQEPVAHVAEFIRQNMVPARRLRFLLTVCTGSGIAAQAGVLEGRRATSNKNALGWISERYPSVNWVQRARWVVDDNLWTASGITAGMDMMFAFVADQYGADVAARIAKTAEYTRNMDPDDDPFAKE